MKLRLAVATAALAVAALTGLAACGQGANSASADSGSALTPEQTALTLLGYSTDDVVADTPASDPTPSPSASGHPKAKAKPHHPLKARRALARNVEHGEVVIDTKKGAQTLDVQRGTVTAITDTTITVKSTDGFTLTWTFGSPLRVIEHRTTIQPKDVAVGAKVGVAGVKQGSTTTANLVVIPNP
jgi:hypothetical protein